MLLHKNKKLLLCSYPVGNDIPGWTRIAGVMASIIKKHADKVEDIALLVTGSSGAIIGTLVASKLKNYNVKVKHLKKDGEKSHSMPIPRVFEYEKCFILDDQVSTGETLARLLYKFQTDVEAIIVIDRVEMDVIKSIEKNYLVNHFYCLNYTE